jgi:hypothetical protein
MAIFWNTHGRITPDVAQAHITDLLSLFPPITLPSPFEPKDAAPDATTAPPPLDTPDEHALRALLLGITHRAAGHTADARRFLQDAHARAARIPSTGSTWIGGVALFELAVLELRAEQHKGEGENSSSSSGASNSSSEEEEEEAYGARELRVRVDALALDGPGRARWNRVLKDATALLDSAMSLSGSEVDLSSRLESRVAMLRDEIALKREMIGGS